MPLAALTSTTSSPRTPLGATSILHVHIDSTGQPIHLGSQLFHAIQPAQMESKKNASSLLGLEDVIVHAILYKAPVRNVVVPQFDELTCTMEMENLSTTLPFPHSGLAMPYRLC
ncbi:hypothetical protein LBMAG45_14140 [Nitrospirota bacterium]|nr:hypothetical protein LBMAG45_14140 [Nitrospirota bacterium]